MAGARIVKAVPRPRKPRKLAVGKTPRYSAVTSPFGHATRCWRDCRSIPVNLLTSDLSLWLVDLIAFLFGATWGSFFNVAIYRLPRGMSVVSPPSQCPSCGKPIPARHNVPILGYLFLRGRTACCNTPLSARYPLVELLTAVLAMAITHREFLGAPADESALATSLLALLYFAFVGGLLVATFVDLERMEIPDEVSLPGAALGLATIGLRDPQHAVDYALGAGGGYLVVQLVFVWSYERLTGRRGMGEGDAKLLLMIGAFVGWQGALFATVIGSLQGVIVALFGLLTGKPLGPDLAALEAQERAEAAARGEPWPDDESGLEDDEKPPSYFGHIKLPFGPFLALGALEYLFFGPLLIERWFALVLGE